MKLFLYTIQDIKSGFFPPFTAQSDKMAARHGQMLMKDEKSQLYHYPEDYRLWRTGEFDSDKGLTTGPAGAPIFVSDFNSLNEVKDVTRF